MDAKNRTVLDEKFICPICSYILYGPVQFSVCGHRICQLCFQNLGQPIVKCPQCDTQTSIDQIMIDHGHKREMVTLPITCSYCSWTGILKDYEEHVDGTHQNVNCEYCNEPFNRIHQLNRHRVIQCQKNIVDCELKNFGCFEKFHRCKLTEHYRSKQHQASLMNIFMENRALLTKIQEKPDDIMQDVPLTTTISKSNVTSNTSTDFCELIHTLTKRVEMLSDDTAQLHSGLLENKAKLHDTVELTTNAKQSVEESSSLHEQIVQNLSHLSQDATALKDKIDGMENVFSEGILIWRITNVRTKMADAQAERQVSIYSPPFFSSPTGYKMRARLYLNGDGNARRTHMSLFFVLMRGPNDGILKFPFNYKVTFCLYDQTPQQRHIIDSFRPDIKSNSFQRPRSEMNIASGIPKFFPLALIQQENNPYVQDDTMFIKVMVEFNELPKALLPYALTLNPGLPTNVQERLIKSELESRSLKKTNRSSNSQVD